VPTSSLAHGRSVDDFVRSAHDHRDGSVEILARRARADGEHLFPSDAGVAGEPVVVAPLEGLLAPPHDPQDRQLAQLRVEPPVEQERVEPDLEERRQVGVDAVARADTLQRRHVRFRGLRIVGHRRSVVQPPFPA
jgi:hypothetical protein